MRESKDEPEHSGQNDDNLNLFEDILKHVEFRKSLYDIDACYVHSMEELDELQQLQAASLPDLLRRLAYVHCVTILEAFLMYAGRALLNYPWYLERFKESSSDLLQGRELKAVNSALKLENECTEPFMWRFREIPGQEELEFTAVTFASEQHFKNEAQKAIEGLTFHNPRRIKQFFSSMLFAPPNWPLDDRLRSLVDTRNDLVHRNGVTRDNFQVTINPLDLLNAVESVRNFITVAYEDISSDIIKNSPPKR